MKRLFYTLLFLGSCGSAKETHPDFLPYIRVYQGITGKVVTTPVYYGDVRGETALEKLVFNKGADLPFAVCVYTYINQTMYNKRIIVNRLKFDMADATIQEVIILHELVHCESEYRRHDYSGDKYSLKLMAPGLPYYTFRPIEYFRNQVNNY